MTLQSRLRITVTMLAPLAAWVLLSCGNRPAEQSQAPAASPAAAPAEPATPPAGDQVAQTTPPPAQAPTPALPAAKPVEKPAPRPKPVPKPEPPAPKPAPVVKTVPVGTDLNVELVDGASSLTSQVGTSVRARVTQPVVIDGLTVVSQGAIVHGTVTEAVSLKKIGGKASLGLRFDSVEVGGGGTAPIVAAIKEQGKSETGKDAGTIAGATAGGALLGRLLSKDDKTKGTLIGAAVGAAAGTGIAAGTKGKEVELPAGTPLALHLEQPLTVTLQP